MEETVTNDTQRLESLECSETEQYEIDLYHHALLDIFAQQRKELFALRKEKYFSDEEIRKAELQLDLNELRITGAGH